jgi:hypothetical protein
METFQSALLNDYIGHKITISPTFNNWEIQNFFFSLMLHSSTDKPDQAFTSIKQSPVLKGHLFPVIIENFI